MTHRRYCYLLLLGLAVGCGGSGQPADSASDEGGGASAELLAKLESQTEAACENLRDCGLIQEGQAELDSCVSRGLYTVEVGTEACFKIYLKFEACVEDASCSTLEELFKSGQDGTECRKEGATVQQECNVNVL